MYQRREGYRMTTKKELFKHITKLEDELTRLKKEIDNFTPKNISLEGKFPELSSIDTPLIDEAQGELEREFKAELHDSK